MGLTNKELAQYTRDEIERLKKGQELIQEEKERQRESGRTPSQSQKQREEEALQGFE